MPLAISNNGYEGTLREANRYGIGDASSTVSNTASIASATLSVPKVAAIIGISSKTAALIAGPIIGGVALAAMIWLNRKGPKQKEATTQYVNEAEPILQQNLTAFMNGPKTEEDKEFALAVFDKIWAEVVNACSQSSMGNPGKACIEDRKQGACKWTDENGECWNWFIGYRDPIANSPTNSSITSVAGIANTLEDTLGSNWIPLLVGAGVLIAGASLIGDRK